MKRVVVAVAFSAAPYRFTGRIGKVTVEIQPLLAADKASAGKATAEANARRAFVG